MLNKQVIGWPDSVDFLKDILAYLILLYIYLSYVTQTSSFIGSCITVYEFMTLGNDSDFIYF